MYPIVRLYSDAHGDTHFEDLEIPLHDAGGIGFLSDKIPVDSIIFREVAPSYDYNFHTAPQRQYIILINGTIEIETSLGVKRNFKGGDVLLLEDVTGKGHRTRNLEAAARKSVFITLREGF